MLTAIRNRKTLNVVGLNSGTSADGVDLAAVRVSSPLNGKGIKFLAGKTYAYPAQLREAIHRAINNESSLDEIIDLDRRLGIYYGRRIRSFCTDLKGGGIAINVVASHGQTVRHLPGKVKIGGKKQSGTLQLGHPASIADQTGLVTVADFRQGDIAAGGEGAPITANAMARIFTHPREDRMLVNIGGIANYFFIPAGGRLKDVRARDCGPGNALIDLAARHRFGRSYDRGGTLARRGSPSKRLVTILLADDYLKGKYGPSTGKERFGERYYGRACDAARRLGLSRYDFIASLTHLTAAVITNTVKPVLKEHELDRIYLFGGGAANKYLIRALSGNLPGIELFPVAALGYHPDYLEAVCYAVMGALTLRSRPNCLAHITGAERNVIGGCIVQPGGTK